jgi:hypothetical protein
VVRLTACCLALAASPAPAQAHHQGTTHASSPDGIAIPGLTHGQMVAVARNKPAILALAADQPAGDPVGRRLAEHVGFQSFACLWSLVPGSLRDEANPFNECTHATLAATMALYRHLLPRLGGSTAAKRLAARIEADMLESGAAVALCRFSDEAFSTAEIVTPSWGDVLSSPSTMATLAGLLALCGGLGWLALRLTRTGLAGPQRSPIH